MIERKRNSSIELLRIIAEIGIVFLHYNATAFKSVLNNSINYYALSFIESVFIFGVDLFIIISSYYLSQTNTRKLSKVFELLFQLIFFRVSIYFIQVFLEKTPFCIKSLISACLPINYFVILYLVLYIISPYLNVLMGNLNKKQLKIFFYIVFFLFSIWSYFVDVLNFFISCNGMSSVSADGAQSGYTIVNFVLLYIVGYIINRKIFIISKKLLLICSFLCLVIIYLLSIYAGKAWSYNNPFVIIYAACIFCLFIDIDFNSKTINNLSKSSFTCYLIFDFVLDRLPIDNYANSSLCILLSNELFSSLYIFFISFCIYKIYFLLTSKTIHLFFKFFDNFNIIDI